MDAYHMYKKRKFPLLLFAAWAVFLLGLVGYFVYTTRAASYKQAAGTSANEARILANSLDASLLRISGLMDWVAHVLEDGQPIGNISNELALLSAYFPELVDFSYYSAQGEKIASSTWGNCLAAPDLRNLFARAGTSLEYSDTIRCEQTGKPVLMIYRAIGTSPDNPGFLVASLNLGFYEVFFSRLEVGEHGMVSFRRSDTSQLLVRWPVSDGRMNNLAPTIPPQLAINQGSREGVVRYVGGTDGVERIFAYQQLDDFPFYALVGRETGEVFAAWTQYSAIASLAAVLLLITSGVFLVKLEDSLKHKTMLINELLHRTNNSLQLVLSLIQLSMFEAPASCASGATDKRFSSLLARVRSLGLAQAFLDTDCSSVLLEPLLQAVATKAVGVETGLTITVDPPKLTLLLDYAGPLALVLNELLMAVPAQQGGCGSLTVRLLAEGLHVVLKTGGSSGLAAGSMELIETLCSHQLGAVFNIVSDKPLECTILVPPGHYKNRVRKEKI